MAANLFSDVFKFAGSAINQALTPDNLRDFRHASKLFVDDQYRLVPKNGFLFHVYFDINPNAKFIDPYNSNKDKELGMLVKSASLPKFTVETKRFNSYNRPNYIQTKINYDSIVISFHDDTADVVRNFWFDYFNYYYRDSDYSPELYRNEYKYKSTRPTDKWGYTTRFNVDEPYLHSIRIYSLNRKKFSEYRLINPIIKSFRHGEHQQGSTDLLQHEMTIEYESVLYFNGSTSPSTVNGFADLHYDKTPSPLTPAGGGTKSILGPGGLFDTGSEAINDLAEGNYGAALFKGAKAIKAARSMDLKRAAIGEALELGKGIIRGNNPENRIFVPSLPSLSSDLSVVGSKLSGIGGPATWLAGAAGLSIGKKLTTQSSSNDEVTDASVYRSGQTPATPRAKLPLDPPSALSPISLRTQTVVNTEPKSITQTDVNYRGEKYDLSYQYEQQRKLSRNYQIDLQETKKQKQLNSDAKDILTNKRDSLLEGGLTEDSIVVKDLNNQIKELENYNNELQEKITSIDNQIVEIQNDIEYTKMRIKSLR